MDKVGVLMKVLDESAIVPVYQTNGSSGFDLHALETIEAIAGGTYLIRTGLSFDLPNGFEMQIRPRSGVSYKTGLRIVNSPGTIDSDFRGELCIIVQNTGADTYTIEKGDRIAQGVLAEVRKAIFHVVNDLSITTRGSGGFGSTGV